ACLPRSLIQSVVQAGDSVTSTCTCCTPLLCSTDTMSASISRIAGQPEYVGVMVTTQRSFWIATLRTIPQSTTDITGISGAGTAWSHSMTCAAVIVASAVGMSITMLRPGKLSGDVAFPPANTPTLLYDDPVCRHGVPGVPLLRQEASPGWLRQ